MKYIATSFIDKYQAGSDNNMEINFAWIKKKEWQERRFKLEVPKIPSMLCISATHPDQK